MLDLKQLEEEKKKQVKALQNALKAFPEILESVPEFEEKDANNVKSVLQEIHKLDAIESDLVVTRTAAAMQVDLDRRFKSEARHLLLHPAQAPPRQPLQLRLSLKNG